MTEQADKPAPRRRWLYISLGVVAVFAIVLIGTPFLIKKLAEDWFIDQGLQQASIRDVDFNPFNAELQIHDLETTLRDDTVLRFTNAHLEADWWPLFRRHVRINQLRLKDASIVIEQKDEHQHAAGISTVSDGTEAAPEAEAGKPWLLGVGDLSISNTEVHVNLPQMQARLHLDSLSIEKLNGWDADTPGRLLATGQINKAPFTLEGNLQPFSQEKIFDIDLSLSEFQLTELAGFMPEGDKLSKGQADVAIAGRLTVAESGAVSWLQAGPVTVTDLNLKTGDTRVDSLDLEWNGELSFDQAGNQLDWQGPLKVSGFKAALKALPSLAVQGLDWEGKGRLMLGDAFQPSSEGKLSLAGLDVETAEGQTAKLGKLAIASVNVAAIDQQTLGGLQVNDLSFSQDELKATLGAAQAKTIAIDAKGQSIKGLGLSKLSYQDSDRKAALGKLSAKSVTNRASGEQSIAGLELQGIDVLEGAKNAVIGALAVGSIENGKKGQQLKTITVNKLAVSEGKDAELAQVNTLSIASVTRDADGPVQVQTIAGKGTKLLKPKAADNGLVELAQIAIDRVRMVPEQSVAIGDVLLSGLNTRLVLNEQGVVQGLPAGPAAEPGAAAVPASDSTASENPLKITINSIEIAKDSELRFVDQSVEPDYTLDARVETLKISGLDSSNPEKPGKLALALAINDHGKLTLDGPFAPLTTPPNMDLKGKLTALELLPASPYSEGVIGYQLRSGQVGANIRIKIQDGILDVANDLKISKLKVKAVPDAKSKLAVPLDTGLAMLRDKHGVIKLKLPVKGQYNSPDFDISDVINQALSKALQTAASTYLVYALQPYGSALAAYKLAGKIGNSVSLEPLIYPAGSAEIPQDQSDYLNKVAKLLNDRPQLGLRFCGFATKADHLAMNKPAQLPAGTQTTPKPAAEPPVDAAAKAKLQELAKQRGLLVKKALINDHKLGADRLFECAPELDLEDDSKPRVEIGL